MGLTGRLGALRLILQTIQTTGQEIAPPRQAGSLRLKILKLELNLIQASL
jgi:hypothetical protein